MKNSLFSTLAVLALLSGCASTQENAKPEAAAGEPAALANDYPTRDRVEYVLECVAKHGGLTYISQYACGCKIDKIAEKLSFSEYESAKTFTQMQKTPGEAGAAFRDAKQSKDLRTRLKDAEAEAEKACFVN
ncbi:hypothetical protein ACH50O_01280 [Methylomonas sp. 2BW1-5-20]|uniref:hypothetical protein n=1 Tax=Methylomonas sp. 2BW1-5-20 TaxID=3376686 RepID=UPI00404C3047